MEISKNVSYLKYNNIDFLCIRKSWHDEEH